MVFADHVQQILSHKVVKVPLFQERMENDGSLFVFGQTNITEFLNNMFGSGVITLAEIASLYPGLSGFLEISQIDRDFIFVW
jgi:hypothetical protein